MNCEKKKRLMAAVAMLYAAGGAQVTPILAVAMLSAATAQAQVQIGKSVQIGGAAGGATFPSTPNIVVNTSSTTARNAVASDVVNLFPGTGPCFLKSDGTCAAGGGGTPGGANTDVQINATGTFGADSGNLTNNATTHNFHQKQLNGIPYAGNYTTGLNGITNAFSAIGNTGVIVNNSENAGDTTNFGPGTNSTIIDLQNGTLGHRLHNCVVNPFLFPNTTGNAGVCESDVVQFDVTPNAIGTGITQNFKGVSTFVSGAGINNGNIGPTDSGWSTDLGQWWQTDSFRDGISGVVEIEGQKYSLGDFQGIESRIYTNGGGNTDISGEGVNNLVLQGGQPTFYPTGTVTTTTGTGDVTPVVSINHPISSGTYMIDTQTALATGALATGGGLWSESTYLSLLPTTAAVLTPSTGDCVTVTDTIHLAPTAGVPVSSTFHCTVGALGPLTTGFAYITSVGSLAEGVTITSAPAPVGGVQTITALTALAHFPGSNVIQGGTHGCLSFDANLSTTGVRSSYTVFGAKDSTHMIYGFLTAGHVLGNTLPMIGNEPETLTAGSNGFHVFPCAQVAYINPGSFGQAFHLRQNDVAWHNGDTIEFPFNPAVNMHQLFSDHTVTSPSNGIGSASAFFQYAGPGVTGNYSPFTLRNNNGFNGSSGMYQVNGGWAIAPTAISVQGPHDVDLLLGENPKNAVININSDHGVAYGIVTSNGGTFGVDPVNHQYTFSLGVNANSLSVTNLADSGNSTSFSYKVKSFVSGPNAPMMSVVNGSPQYGCLSFIGACANATLNDANIVGDTTSADKTLYVSFLTGGNLKIRTLQSGTTFQWPCLFTATTFDCSVGAGGTGTGASGNFTSVTSAGTVTAAAFQGSGATPKLATGTASNTDPAGEFTLSAATTAGPYVWANVYTSHPEVNLQPQFDIGSGNRCWVTYTGVTSFTINCATAVTGTIGYTAIARN